VVADTGARSEAAAALRGPVVRLMATRLLVAVLSFVLAVVVVGVGREGSHGSEELLYGTLAAAFLLTVVYAGIFRLIRRMDRFAAVQLATDIAIVTSLVTASGGADSIFGFLYLPIAVYGAILFGRVGAYGAAVLGAAGYGVALWLAPHLFQDFSRSTPPDVAFALWCAESGALLLVALLSSALAHELQITGQRLHQSRRDLRALQSLHERTVECLTSGLLTTDPEGWITSFNPEAERISGVAAAEAVGRRLDDLLPGAWMLASRNGGTPGRLRTRLSIDVGGGRVRHVGVAASVLRGPDGAPSGHVVIFQDVTEVVRMESELRRTERLAGVGELAASIAHEIRNPLAAISGSVEMLVAGERGAVGGGGDPEHARLMQIVLREIDRLNALIGDFLQYARPGPAKAVRVDLGRALEELVQMARAGLPDGVAIALDVPAGAAVLADPTQVRQVLWNLVRNAAEAIPSAGEIRVAVRTGSRLPQGSEDGDRNEGEEGASAVEITVSDTGEGIAPEHLDRVFDPFFTTKAEGTGLGLPTVHRIVEQHGGSLQLESRPGVGTTVRLLLPDAGSRS
jgi:two-component system sensor histidine kinase PilS (NtrC family)